MERRLPLIILVHGAWAGAWAVSRLARRLRNLGHVVQTPALSGLEENREPDPSVDLSRHVNDVLHEFDAHPNERFVLVGCSYSGMVITAVADRIPDRTSALVYVDAFVPRDNESVADITGWTIQGDFLPPPPFANTAGKAVPQSAATFTEKVRLTGAYESVRTKLFVQATGWRGPFDSTVRRLKALPSWTVVSIACGHDIANEQPDELARLIDGASR